MRRTCTSCNDLAVLQCIASAAMSTLQQYNWCVSCIPGPLCLAMNKSSAKIPPDTMKGCNLDAILIIVRSKTCWTCEQTVSPSSDKISKSRCLARVAVMIHMTCDMYLPSVVSDSSVEAALLESAGLFLLKDMCTLMKPPSPAADGLNISNHLSMGTAAKMSSTKIPVRHAAYYWLYNTLKKNFRQLAKGSCATTYETGRCSKLQLRLGRCRLHRQCSIMYQSTLRCS